MREYGATPVRHCPGIELAYICVDCLSCPAKCPVITAAKSLLVHTCMSGTVGFSPSWRMRLICLFDDMTASRTSADCPAIPQPLIATTRAELNASVHHAVEKDAAPLALETTAPALLLPDATVAVEPRVSEDVVGEAVAAVAVL